jgi:uncharacterized repeat protein (TIGR01451 family)
VRLLPGDAEAWLVFSPVVGVAAYEVSVSDASTPGVWSRVSASDLVLPVALKGDLEFGIETGSEVCAQVRVVGAGVVGEPSAVVCVMPVARSYVPSVRVEVAAPEGAADRAEVSADGRLVFDFTLSNSGTADLQNVWLKPFVPEGSTLVSVVPRSGGTLTDFGDAWFWADVNLEAAGSATLRMTVQLEVNR